MTEQQRRKAFGAICYAASEFAAGRISAHELIQTVKQGDDGEAVQ